MSNPWIPEEGQTVSFCPLWATTNQRRIVELFHEEGLDTSILPFKCVKHATIDHYEWTHQETGEKFYRSECRETGAFLESNSESQQWKLVDALQKALEHKLKNEAA